MKKARHPQQSGRLIMPYGLSSWHFKHGLVNGSGYNGAIKHMWREPVQAMAIPGKGLVQNG